MYLSSTEFKDQRRLADGGHPNHCQGAADIQIHLRHLLHQKELRQNPAWGRALPFIQLSVSTRVYILLK